jgi:starch synthase
MRHWNVFHVTREFAGLAEAGGVKDAVSGLVNALVRSGVRTTVVLPLYGFMRDKLSLAGAVKEFVLGVPDQDRKNQIREELIRIYSLERNGGRFFLVDSPCFIDKNDVYTYTAGDEAGNQHKKKGTGHWDFHRMNLILQKSALEIAREEGDPPDIFHCHDGHTAFLPALMREDKRFRPVFTKTGAVVTIHNAGVGYHQEIWDIEFARNLTGLKNGVLQGGQLNGTVDPLLLAGSYARMSTVSEQYARELLAEKDAEVSGGLGRMFRERGIKVTGITNGIEPGPFDPRYPDSGLPFLFDPASGDWEGKKKCKRMLLDEMSIPPALTERPLFGFIGRLTKQKGIDVLREAVSNVLARRCPADFVALGQGESNDEGAFRALSEKRFSGGHFRFVSRYDTGLSKRIYAASDFLLIPSEYEPCGLTDFHAQLMGSIPIVHRVGGLVKVRDAETGFSYIEQSPVALAEAILRCISLDAREPGTLEGIRKKAFGEIFEKHTWDIVAREGYLPLYEDAARLES